MHHSHDDALLQFRSAADAARAERVLSRRLAGGLVALVILLYGRNVSNSVGEYNDAFNHLINSIFIYDAACHVGDVLTGPVRFYVNYYSHFPAVSLGYYPPVFPMAAAGFVALFGVSPVSVQIAVLAFAIALALFTYAWARLRFDPWWSALTATTVVTLPMLVRWGRDIMLDVPVAAMVVGAMWAFERMMRAATVRWTDALFWAVLASLAIWTKQHAVFLLPVFAVAPFIEGRIHHLKSAPLLVSGALLTLSLAVLVYVTLMIGGAAVGHSIGTSKGGVLSNPTLWISYWAWLPIIVGWPVLILATVGVGIAVTRREPFTLTLVAWVVCFYLMHSYMKAQNPRYGCLWIPAFGMLASIALHHARPWMESRMARSSRGRILALAAFALLPVYHFAWGAQLAPPFPPRYVADGAQLTSRLNPAPTVYERPRVPPSYLRAVENLADRLAPFYCLTHFPDRPGRIATNFRIALQSRLRGKYDIFSFGGIARADQVVSAAAPEKWTPAEFSAALKRWNVRFIMTETPRSSLMSENSERIESTISALLETGDYQVIARFPIRLERKPFDREVLLYERVEAMQLNPGARPPVKPRRVPMNLREAAQSEPATDQ
ncbi:MAG: glycosyltransferase family 39 protein [Phycisphaerae bacterium]